MMKNQVSSNLCEVLPLQPTKTISPLTITGQEEEKDHGVITSESQDISRTPTENCTANQLTGNQKLLPTVVASPSERKNLHLKPHCSTRSKLSSFKN